MCVGKTAPCGAANRTEGNNAQKNIKTTRQQLARPTESLKLHRIIDPPLVILLPGAPYSARSTSRLFAPDSPAQWIKTCVVDFLRAVIIRNTDSPGDCYQKSIPGRVFPLTRSLAGEPCGRNRPSRQKPERRVKPNYPGATRNHSWLNPVAFRKFST